jgi:hypothetical protein
MAQTNVDRRRELTGTPKRGLTSFHQWNPGIPPSRENAHVHLDAAVNDPIVAKTHIPRTTSQHISISFQGRDLLRIVRPRAAPGDPVTVLYRSGMGCSDATSKRG